ncbi:MAG: SMC family ATPase [candidate division WOR-3 bacterium]
MIRKIKIRNLFQFNDLEVEFSPNFNCILGPNGSGKTNLMNCIKYALIGNVNYRTKRDIVRIKPKLRNDEFIDKQNEDYNEDGEESYVSLTMEGANKKPVKILRKIKPNNLVLLNYDGETIYNHTNVLEKLCSIYGIMNYEIFEYCFIPQRELDKYIQMTDTERIKYLSKIFGINIIDRICDKINKLCLELPTTEYKNIELRRLNNEISEIINQIDETKKEIEIFTEKRDRFVISNQNSKSFSIEEEIRAIVNERDKLIEIKNLAANKGNIRSEIKNLENKLNELVEKIKLKKKDLELNNELLEKNKNKLRELNRLEEFYNEQKKIYKDLAHNEEILKSINNDFEKIIKDFRNRPKIRSDIKYKNYDKLINLMSKQTLKIQQLKDEISNLSNILKNEFCSLCKRPIVSDDKYIDYVNSKIKRLNFYISKRKKFYELLKSRVNEILNYRSIKEKRNEIKNLIKYKAEEIRNKREKLIKDLKTPSLSKEELDNFENTKSICKISIEYTEKIVKSIENDIDELNKSINEASFKLSKYKNILESYSDYEDFDINLLNNKIKELEDIINEINKYNIKIETCNGYLIHLEQLLKSKNNEKRNLLDNYKVRERLERIKSIFGSDGAIKIFTRNMMETCEDIINEILSLFNANFRVSCDGTSLVASFNDGKIIEDRFLSVGEKLILSLGWELSTKISSFGFPPFLFFDEPAAGLDEENINIFPEILNKIKNYSHKKNLQIFMITHDNLPPDLFDKVIKLHYGKIVN